MLARSAVHLFFLGISFVCVLAIASDAAAYQIRVLTNSAAPGPDGNVSDDDVTMVVGPTIEVQIANTIDYTPFGESTQYDTIGRAVASPSQLGVEAHSTSSTTTRARPAPTSRPALGCSTATW